MVAAALLYHWVATHLYLLTSWAGLAAITIIIARWQWERVERLVPAATEGAATSSSGGRSDESESIRSTSFSLSSTFIL